MSNPPIAPPAPEAFGKYQLLERIAQGGMAEVFRARSHGAMGFEKILVVKRILDTLAKDEEFRDLFTNEARIAAELSHVNIVQVFELGKENEHLYIAMEYVHGLDLARLSSRSRTLGDFPVNLALFVVGEVLKALAYAHAAHDADGEAMNIVHCDISPQNVLISFSGEVKLTDFGISRAAIQRGNENVIRGKYSYMSPEQAESRHLDGRSDLFSLGTMLYEILTGRRLFKAASRDETLARVRRAEVPSPRPYRKEISEDLEGFILRTLSRLPDDRFADAHEMYEALSKIIVSEGHRATNNDLAQYLREVIDAATAAAAGHVAAKSPKSLKTVPPQPLVALALEASPPPRSIASPRTSIATLSQEWLSVIGDQGGEVWERGDGSLLVVWQAGTGFKETVGRAVRTAVALQRLTAQAGYRLSAGIAPGVARVRPDTHRPSEGWELAGPFYLARWMMNLSAHRGRVLLTEVGAKQIDQPTVMLGRIPIQGNRYINLHEVA
ncbi:MAG: serine/threonine protein kinase [Deltaproteobacteria bacterium]|nr:serine/threonine protein kinase [Deltaproteobacteria bacterium]